MDYNLVNEKLMLVTNKLMNLEVVEVKEVTEEALKKGYYPRDFGMEFWDWPQGVGMYGLFKLYSEQNREEYKEYMTKWYETKSKEKIIKNVNTCAPLLTLTKFDSRDKYLDMLNEWAEWAYKGLERTDEGIIQHVTSNTEGTGVKLNPNEVWIDTIYMTILFLNEMGVRFERKDWLEEVDYQLLQHIKYLYDKKTGLFYHGYTFKENNNFGGVFWCRGNSWFTSAMVDYLECRGTDSFLSRYILELLNNQVEALIKYQNDSGLWSTIITNQETYDEVSGSASIVGAILKAIRLNYVDKKYLANCEKAIKAILESIDETGVVLKVSAGTSIGYDEEHYKAIVQAPMAYGQALAIIALSEYLNHI